MFAAVGQRRYPVTVPVIAEGCERQCPHCRRWSDVDEWPEGAPPEPGQPWFVDCPRCLLASRPAKCPERALIGLFTCILPVPPRHEPIAFADDARRQAVNAIAAARACRQQARKHGLELA